MESVSKRLGAWGGNDTFLQAPEDQFFYFRGGSDSSQLLPLRRLFQFFLPFFFFWSILRAALP